MLPEIKNSKIPEKIVCFSVPVIYYTSNLFLSCFISRTCDCAT